MINLTDIQWPNSTEYWFCPALPFRKLEKLRRRFELWHVKYCTAAFGLGIYEGGYKNCPTLDEIQDTVDLWWQDQFDEPPYPPPPQYDPIIFDPLVTLIIGDGWGQPLATTEALADQSHYNLYQAMIYGHACWTCLIVGCNTMFIELQRQSSRGRPRKHHL